MNEASRLSASAPPTARPTSSAARPSGASRSRSEEDEAAPADAPLLAPVATPPLLGAWQAALLARQMAPAAFAAGAVASPTATQQAIGSSMSAGQGQPESPSVANAQAEATPLRFEAEIRPGAGPAWQLALQRGPDAAAWSLQLATPAVPAVWAATQLPRLERRLRSQGHEVQELGWRPLPEREQQEDPR